jgi:hypothetical protein
VEARMKEPKMKDDEITVRAIILAILTELA